MVSHSKIYYIHISISSGSYAAFIGSVKEHIYKLLGNNDVNDIKFMLYGPAYWSSKLLDELIIDFKNNNISSIIVGNTSSVLLSTIDHFIIMMDSYDYLVYPYQKYIVHSNNEKLRIIKLQEKKDAV